MTHSIEDCWVKHPHKAPKHLREEYEKRAKEMKSKASSNLAAAGDNTNTSLVKANQAVVSTADEDTKRCFSYTLVGIDDDIVTTSKEIGTVNAIRPDDWIIDSGASEHFVASSQSFIDGTAKPCRRAIRTATGQITFSTLSGDVRLLLLQHDGSINEVQLRGVLYVPDISINLVGTICLGRKGVGVNLLPDKVVITDMIKNEVVGYGDIVGNQYLLRLWHREPASAQTAIVRKPVSLPWVSPRDELYLAAVMNPIEMGEKTSREVALDDLASNTICFSILSSVSQDKISEGLVESSRRAVLDETICHTNLAAHPSPASQDSLGFSNTSQATSNQLDRRRVNLHTWHRRLGHLSYKNIQKLAEMSDGLDIKGLLVPKYYCLRYRVGNSRI